MILVTDFFIAGYAPLKFMIAPHKLWGEFDTLAEMDFGFL